MSTFPYTNSKPYQEWQKFDGSDYLQLKSATGGIVAWIDGNGNPQGALNTGIFSGSPGVLAPTQGVIVANVPLASTADILSITSDGTNFLLTCNVPACGLTNGVTINLGLGLPASCADLSGNTNSASGNTIKMTNSGSCTASAGPYHGQIGQVGNAIFLQNSASFGFNSYARITQTADAHTTFGVYSSGVLSTLLDLHSDGPLSLSSPGAGVSFSIGPSDGLACIGQPSGVAGTNCVATGFNNTGVAMKYSGLVSAAGHGFPFEGYGNYNTPRTGSGASSTFGPFTVFTSPASGYGANALYRLTLYAVATTGVASSTVQAQINYTDASGANSQNSGAATSFATTGNKLIWTTTLFLAPNSTFAIQFNEANAPVYNLSFTLEAM